MSKPFHVLIIGGGVGGLTLAQGLKRSGISAAVYERDRTPTDRLQGYRVHVSPTGSSGLHECLPPELFDIFDRTCGSPNNAVRFFTEQMRELLSFERELVQPTDPIALSSFRKPHHVAASSAVRARQRSVRQDLLALRGARRSDHRAFRGRLVGARRCPGGSRRRRLACAAAIPAACPAHRDRRRRALPAKSFSTPREIASRAPCWTGSASSRPAAATVCSLPSRR